MFEKLLIVLGTHNMKMIKTSDGKYIRLSRGSDECGEFVKVEKELSHNELEVKTYYKSNVELVSYRDNYLRKG